MKYLLLVVFGFSTALMGNVIWADTMGHAGHQASAADSHAEGGCPMTLGKDKKPLKGSKECCCKHKTNGNGGHGGMFGAVKGDQRPSSQDLNQANATMHVGMDIVYSGDADIDFLKGMIAHHQGAVDMAKVQLQYGRDAKTKRLAQEIIRAQNLEIRWMKIWLTQLEKRGVRKADPHAPMRNWSDSSWMGKSWLGER